MTMVLSLPAALAELAGLAELGRRERKEQIG